MRTLTAMLEGMPSQKEPSTIFGARLMAARHARGMTQTQLADLIGSTQRAISYYEAAGGSPTTDAVIKLANALGTTTDELLGVTPTAEPVGTETTDERRLWRRFKQLVSLPEKDRRAVLRMLDSLTKHQGSDTANAG